jgi:hypothetical protein
MHAKTANIYMAEARHSYSTRPDYQLCNTKTYRELWTDAAAEPSSPFQMRDGILVIGPNSPIDASRKVSKVPAPLLVRHKKATCGHLPMYKTCYTGGALTLWWPN